MHVEIRELMRKSVRETLRTLCSTLKEDMTRDRCRRVRFSGKEAAESSRGKSLEDAGAGKLGSATCARAAGGEAGEKGMREG